MNGIQPGRVTARKGLPKSNPAAVHQNRKAIPVIAFATVNVSL